MFELSVKKEELLSALLIVAGAVDKKQSLAILANFLLTLADNQLRITANDLELEISAQITCVSDSKAGAITVPAKKMIDIIRSLDDKINPQILYDGRSLSIKQDRSSFKLATLPAEKFPLNEEPCNEVELSLPRVSLLKLLQSTHFALPQQEVRIFLNGLYFELGPDFILAIATDGHRMAINRLECSNNNLIKLLLPKKGVQELIRLLNCISDEQVVIAAGKSHFKLLTQQFVFLTKLIEARFPSYSKAIPKNQDKEIIIDNAVLKKALMRIIILAHEKFKSVTLHLQPNQVTLIANNNDEEAMEQLNAKTAGGELKIGFNANYLLDVLNYFNDEVQVRLSFSEATSSILIESLDDDQYQYIIMPMKI